MARATRGWTKEAALKLARTKVQDSTEYTHPTEPGFLMRVSPLGKAVWAYRFRDAQGKIQGKNIAEIGELSGGGRLSLDDALDKFRQIRTRLKSPASGVAVGLNLREAFESWKVEHRNRKGGGKLSQETLKDYQAVFDRVLAEEAGDWPLQGTTTLEWRRVLLKYQKKSLSQTRRAYWLLHSIYADIIELDETFGSNPLNKRALRNLFSGEDAKAPPRATYVKTLDLAAFLSGVTGLRNNDSRDAILAIVLSSWRRSAVLRMRWEQIDWEQGVYNVRKGDVGWKGFVGQMALNDYMLSILRDRYEKRESTEYVFPSRHGSKPYMQDIRASLGQACKSMGYTVSKHDLRRTFATIARVVLRGDTYLLGLLMGHRQPSTAGQPGEQAGTEITAHYIIRDLQSERVSSTRVAEAILEIGGLLPMDDGTVALFKERGIDVRKPLETLDEVEDDEDEE